MAVQSVHGDSRARRQAPEPRSWQCCMWGHNSEPRHGREEGTARPTLLLPPSAKMVEVAETRPRRTCTQPGMDVPVILPSRSQTLSQEGFSLLCLCSI